MKPLDMLFLKKKACKFIRRSECNDVFVCSNDSVLIGEECCLDEDWVRCPYNKDSRFGRK
jgi:hypothetical protein